MENSDNLGQMRFNTQTKVSKVLELARTEGFAVVGFALRPDDNAMMQLNNQGMEPMQFLVFLQTCIKAYMTSLPNELLEQFQKAGEA